jgi:hypothetical protein
VVDAVQGTAQAGDPGVQAEPVPADHLVDGCGVAVLPRGDGETDLIQGQFQRAQQVDQPGFGDLITVVEPVPGRVIDGGGLQQPDAVVVPQCLGRQPAAAGHEPDGQQRLRRLPVHVDHVDHVRTFPRGILKQPGGSPRVVMRAC